MSAAGRSGVAPAAGGRVPVATRPQAFLVASVALLLADAGAVSSFCRVFSGAGWVAPVFVCLVATHVAAWACRRGGLGGWQSAVLTTVVLVTAAADTVVPGATNHGVPLLGAWRAMGHALSQARASFATSVAPVPATRGFTLAAAAGTGLCVLVADWAAFRVRSGLQAVIPGIALYIVCSATGTTAHRGPTTAAVVAGSLLVLAAHRAAVTGGTEPWLAGRPAALGAAAGAGVGLGAVAVLAAAIAVPGPRTTNGHGVLGWRGEGPGAGGDRSVISPVVDLQTRLQRGGDTPVFTVDSPVPSYWRLTSLDTFTGVQWESTDTYRGTDGPLPGLPPDAVAAGHPVTEHWHIQSLSSIWVPTAFTPVSVHGAGPVSWDPVSGSLLTAKATSDGLTYSTTSVQELAALSPTRLSAVPLGSADAAYARYVALPSIPPQVITLARRITASATNEYQAALALQNYFVDNPAFTYTLHPPDDGYGTAALFNFLFHTRSGYCQQFAGAYAVLARAVGLPTRLAVGFATGTDEGGGHYQVTDADAHTWPEVWFGPQVGWVPFEPTKGGGFTIPGASGYTGATGGGGAAPQPVTVPAPATTPTPPLTLPKTPAHLPRDQASPSSAAHATGPRAPSAALLVLAALALAGAGWVTAAALGWTLRQRRRHRMATGAPPDERDAVAVLAAWSSVTDTLGIWGLRRRPDETQAEFAARAGHSAGALLGDRQVAARLGELAGVAAEATYRAGPLDHERAQAAVSAAERLDAALQHAAPLGSRARRLLDPRAAWRPVDA